MEIIANDQGNRITPSYVAFTDSERLIGDAAKNQVGWISYWKGEGGMQLTPPRTRCVWLLRRHIMHVCCIARVRWTAALRQTL